MLESLGIKLINLVKKKGIKLFTRVYALLTLIAAISAYWFATFELQPAKALDVVDIIIEGSILLLILIAYMLIAQLNIVRLQFGWGILAIGRLIDFFDEFTEEPEFLNTVLEGILVIIGLSLVVMGVYQAYLNLKSNVIRLKELQKELRTRVITDPLTGLYNRWYFNERVEEEARRAKRYGHPFSFVVIDVDKFKDINDQYSHSVGDEVLKEVGKYLTTSVRESDIVFRYGGDEFVILLPETKSDEAQELVNRLQAGVTKVNPGKKYLGTKGIRLSFGVATWEPQTNISWEEVLKESDVRMYKDKMKNRTGLSKGNP